MAGGDRVEDLRPLGRLRRGREGAAEHEGDLDLDADRPLDATLMAPGGPFQRADEQRRAVRRRLAALRADLPAHGRPMPGRDRVLDPISVAGAFEPEIRHLGEVPGAACAVETLRGAGDVVIV